MHYNSLIRLAAGTAAAFAFSVVTLGSATPAEADVIITTQGSLAPPREEVQFNDGLDSTGNPIRGMTNDTGTIVRFTSNTPAETLTAQANGQARITGDMGLRSLTIELENGFNLDGLSFNLDAVADGTVEFTIDLLDEDDVVRSFDLDRNGVNRFVFTAINGEEIESVTLNANVNLSDIQQVRLSLVAVPEPAAFAALGLVGGLLLLRRRRA